MSVPEIALASGINRLWKSIIDNASTWKNTTYDIKLFWDNQKTNNKYASKLKIMNRCHKLSLSVNTKHKESLPIKRITWANRREDKPYIMENIAKIWIDNHIYIFNNLLSITLRDCVITSKMLKYLTENSPNLQKFEHHLSLFFMIDYDEDEYSHYDDCANAFYNLIIMENLTHLELTGITYPGTTSALIKGIAVSKLKYLHYCLDNMYNKVEMYKIPLLFQEIAKSTTLKTLILMPLKSPTHSYQGEWQIHDSSSITYLNSPIPCKWTPGSFKKLKELVTACHIIYDDANNDIMTQLYCTRIDYSESFIKWFIQCKLKKLSLLNCDTYDSKKFLHMLAEHTFIQELTVVSQLEKCSTGLALQCFEENLISESIFNSLEIIKLVERAKVSMDEWRFEITSIDFEHIDLGNVPVSINVEPYEHGIDSNIDNINKIYNLRDGM
jgi:hypothetical protein